MDEHTMQHLAPGAQKVGDAVLPDHRHLPWGRNVPSTVVPERGSTTRGVLWNVPKSQMPELDALEGVSTNWYERVPVTVKVGRKPHKAEVYREPLPDSKARVVGTGKFSKAFRKARAENPHIRDFTTDFSAKELDQMTLFLTPDGKTGGGLRDLGNGKTEVVGLFNNGGEPGSGTKLLELLISHGGNVLNCFDEFLRKLYEKQGFEVVEQFEWDDQQKPSTWDVNKRGRPPVYLMEIPRWHRLRN